MAKFTEYVSVLLHNTLNMEIYVVVELGQLVPTTACVS